MKKKTLKIFSFLGMMLSMMLMIILPLLYFSMREYSGPEDTILFFLAMLIAVFLFMIGFLQTIQFKWGDKNSFTPIV